MSHKIQPVITSSSFNDFEPHPGKYHLVKLDANGREIEGSDVSVSPNTWRRTYERLTQGEQPTYLLKKNP